MRDKSISISIQSAYSDLDEAKLHSPTLSETGASLESSPHLPFLLIVVV
jgi:hypothetical protein